MANLLVIAYLALLASGFFFSALDGTDLLIERDLSVFFIPPRILWTEILRGGEFPLWNPYYFSGHPLLATLQVGIFHPVNVLLLLLFPFDLAFNWTIITHFIIAGVSTFFLVRELRASRGAALVSALTFMLSGYLFSVHNVMSTLFTVAWAPLALLVYIKSIRKGSVTYALAAGVVLTIMFFGGGIEVLYATAGLLLVVTLAPSIIDIGEARVDCAPLKTRSLLFALSIVVFILLSSVQLLPFLELAGQSTRGGGLSYFEATTWSFDLKDLIQFFVPDPYGYGASEAKYWANQSWLKTVYTGAIPLVLSVFFFQRAGRRAAPFFLVLLVSFTLAMGRNTLLYHYLFAYFPFIDKIRYPVKFLFIPFLFLSISAGLGLDDFRRGILEKKWGLSAVVVLLLVLSTAAALAFGLLDFFDAGVKAFLVERGIDYPEYNYVKINIFNTKRVLFFFILISITLFGALRSRRLRLVLPYLVAAILSIDLFFAHDGYYLSMPAADYHAKGEVAKFLEDDPGLFRVYVTPKTMREEAGVPEERSSEEATQSGLALEKDRLRGMNVEHHIFNIDGIEVMKRADYTALNMLVDTRKSPDSTNILAMLNVKYVVSLPKIDSPEFVLRRIVGVGPDAITPELEESKALKVYENTNYLDRFYTVSKWRIAEDSEESLDILEDKEFLPALEVLLFEEPWTDAVPVDTDVPGPVRAQGKVEVVDYSNNSIELRVSLKDRGILVASESWYPGWKAYVDGSETRILKGNHLMRAVPLEAGTHTVRFVYKPRSFRIGASISVITLFGIVGFFISRRYGRRHV